MLRNKGGKTLRDQIPTQITRKAKQAADRPRTHLQQVDFSYRRAADEGWGAKMTVLHIRNWMLIVG